MDLDDDICLCFHVSKRKVVNYIRINKPKRAGQLSDCFGAGTGCGWCRPFLAKLMEVHAAGRDSTGSDDSISLDEYATQRETYRRKNGLIPEE